MARRTRRTAGAEAPEVLGNNAQQVDAVELALEQLGAGFSGSVVVYKQDPKGGSKTGWSLVGRYILDAFDPFDVRREFGPGLYRFQFDAEDGKGIRKSVQQRFLPTQEELEAERVDQAAASSRSSGAGAGGFSFGPEYFMQEMMARSARMEEAQQALMLGIVQSLGAGRGGGTDIGAGDLLAAIKLGRESGQSPLPHEAAFEALRMGMEFGKDAAAASGGDTLGGIVPKVLDVLDRIAKNPPQQPGSPRPLAPPSRQVAAPPATPHQEPPQAAETPAQELTADNALGPALAYLAPTIVQSAQQGADARLFGAYVADNTSDDWLPVLEQLVGLSPDARLEVLREHAPELVELNGTYLDEAVAGIREHLEDADDQAPAAAGGKGGENDTSPDAVPRGGDADAGASSG